MGLPCRLGVPPMAPRTHELIETQFREFYPVLYQYARIALDNPDWAEDVVQDVFHFALQNADTFNQHPNPRGWLMQTLKNKLKECKRQRRKLADMEQSLDTLPDHILAVEDEVPEEQAEGAVEKIKRRLTKEELHLLKRIVLDKASHTELAKELQITVWASQQRLSRIRGKLRELFRR